MAHARQQIREAVATAVTGLATTGSNVFTSRVYPIEDASLPCLSVYSLSEEVLADADVTGTIQVRSLVVAVEARVKNVSGYDDTLDTICAEVEAALILDSGVLALVKYLELSSTEIEFDSEAENPTGLAVMNWTCLYSVDQTDPETVL